jgi:hypothetical protein
MRNSSAQDRPKRRDDKIDWEELERAPNVDGMLSYLRRPDSVEVQSTPHTPTAAAPALEHEEQAPQAAVQTAASKPRSNDSPPIPVSAPLPVPSPDNSLPKFTRTTNFPGVGKRRLHRCVLVQDAHSPGEQVLLNTLYRMAKNPRWGRTESEGSFLVNAPMTAIAEQTCMHETNIRANLRMLLEKLAIEIVQAEDRKRQSARVYRVFSFKQILERRRAAGLEWVVKNRGVRFVSTQTAQEILASDSLGRDFSQESEVVPSDSLPKEGSELLEPRASGLHPVILGSTNLEKLLKQTSTSVAPLKLVKGLHELRLVFDEEAVTSLWNECQIRAGDCTTEEILYFAKEKAAICRNGKIQNPVGFLLAAVPKCFEGQSFTNFREEQRKRAEAQHRLEREREEAAQQLAAQTDREAEAYRIAEDKLRLMPNEEYEARCNNVKAKLIRDHPQIKSWDKQQIEQTLRRRILRDLQEKELAELLNQASTALEHGSPAAR